MSIDMYLNDSDLQAETTRAVLRNQIAAYEELQTSLNQFVLASPTLSGKTYDSAKAYSSQILLPLIRACILYDEAVIAATEELPERYREEVDVIDLKEWELLDYIDRADSLIERYRELIRQESWKDLPNYDYLNSLSQTITNYENTKSLLEAKLQKLMEFNWSSANLFNHVHDLYYAVQEGMRQATSSWNGESQTFTLPPQEKMTWAANTNARWQNKTTSRVTALISKVESGQDLSTDELNELGRYLIENPEYKIYNKGISAFLKSLKLEVGGVDNTYIENILTDSTLTGMSETLKSSTFSNLIGELYKTNYSASAKNLIAHYLLNSVDDMNYNIGKNLSIQVGEFIGQGIEDGVGDTLVSRGLTSGGTIIGTTVGTVIGLAEGESLGQALVPAFTQSLISGSFVALATVAIGATPVGWVAVGVAVVASIATTFIYENDIMGVKTMSENLGESLDDGLESVGQAISDFTGSVTSWLNVGGH